MGTLALVHQRKVLPSHDHIPGDLVFHIRASPLKYGLGYSIDSGAPATYLTEISSY